MPIYSFACPTCGNKEDVILKVDERNQQRSCVCGGAMDRIMAMASFKLMHSGRTRVLDVLNYEANKPGLRSKRSTAALAHGLERIKPVIGRGFKF